MDKNLYSVIRDGVLDTETYPQTLAEKVAEEYAIGGSTATVIRYVCQFKPASVIRTDY